MIIEHPVEQRSPEWFALRCGTFTASEFHRLMGSASTQDKYIAEKAAQARTGRMTSIPLTADMRRGVELEPAAVAMYEYDQNVDVRECGFFTRIDLPYCGGSPDGMIGQIGCIEIKCPRDYIHYEYCQQEKIPSKYYWQCVGHLLMTGCQWCDFVSYIEPCAPTIPGAVPLPTLHVTRLHARTALHDMNDLMRELQSASYLLEQRIKANG